MHKPLATFALFTVLAACSAPPDAPHEPRPDATTASSADSSTASPAAASTASPAGSAKTAATAPITGLLVRIEFEPPLSAPGEVHFSHESGASGVVPTTCTGVELHLPPGPAIVTLTAPGRRQPLLVRVAPGLPPVVWREQR